eukprot:15768190-Heterocapsa_arctica.AAC.1
MLSLAPVSMRSPSTPPCALLRGACGVGRGRLDVRHVRGVPLRVDVERVHVPDEPHHLWLGNGCLPLQEEPCCLRPVLAVEEGSEVAD